MPHLLSPVLCWLLGSACGPSAFQTPVQERKCKGNSLHFTPLFSLFSKYLQKEQTGISQRVPSHAITVNQHKHLQCTWPPGHGIHTHPSVNPARELLEAWLAPRCVSHLGTLRVLLGGSVQQDVPFAGNVQVDAVGCGIVRHCQLVVAVVTHLLHGLPGDVKCRYLDQTR